MLLKRLLRMARAALHGGWRSVRDVEPDFWLNLRAELLAGRQWVDRGVVLAYATATGLIVVGFTFLSEAATHAFMLLRTVRAAIGATWRCCGRRC